MKFLLVEDSLVLRERLRRMIEDIPHAIVVGESDNEGDALQGMTALRPDSVVLDLKLKAGSGLSVLERINILHPETKVIVLTNYGQSEYRDKCLALGASHFFDKSRDFEAFQTCLSALGQAERAAASTPNHGVSP